jgi:hypothetical protein
MIVVTSSCAATATPFAAAAPSLATDPSLASQDADSWKNNGESGCVAAPRYSDPVEWLARFDAAAIGAAGSDDKVQIVIREDGREKNVMGRWVR